MARSGDRPQPAVTDGLSILAFPGMMVSFALIHGSAGVLGDGRFTPVAADVYNFEVSGLKVVQSWLGYRMKRPKGRKSSPLDEITPERWSGQFTTELLELLWILEATIAGYPHQEKLLTEVTRKPTRPPFGRCSL